MMRTNEIIVCSISILFLLHGCGIVEVDSGEDCPLDQIQVCPPSKVTISKSKLGNKALLGVRICLRCMHNKKVGKTVRITGKVEGNVAEIIFEYYPDLKGQLSFKKTVGDCYVVDRPIIPIPWEYGEMLIGKKLRIDVKDPDSKKLHHAGDVPIISGDI